MDEEYDKLKENVRRNFLVSLLYYLKIGEPEQIASDLNTINKYLSDESKKPTLQDNTLGHMSKETCNEITRIVEQIRNDIKNK